jgi:protein tyrosine phosphatase (PTP) superfamily phosphohydrolase (DUF442 family)
MPKLFYMTIRTLLLCAAVAVAASLAPAAADGPADEDAGQWAAAVDLPGLRNCFQLNSTFYRGGELSPAGACQLQRLGVRTVVSLRLLARDGRSTCGTSLDYIQIPFKVWRPEDCQVIEFLRIATDPARQPVYVYCNRGAERTGMMCAAYRIVVEGWSKEAAIEEMTRGPFDYHAIYKRVVQYIREMDVDYIRREVGLDAPSD